jgi:hypothetical protein
LIAIISHLNALLVTIRDSQDSAAVN